MKKTIDFPTLVRKKLAYHTAKLWIDEMSNCSIHLFTKEYNYITLFKTYDRRVMVEESKKDKYIRILATLIEQELKLNSNFHLCQRQVPDRVLREFYQQTKINFDVILPNTHSITKIGSKNVEFFVNNARLFTKKISV